jgi:hypothetical protein
VVRWQEGATVQYFCPTVVLDILVQPLGSFTNSHGEWNICSRQRVILINSLRTITRVTRSFSYNFDFKPREKNDVELLCHCNNRSTKISYTLQTEYPFPLELVSNLHHLRQLFTAKIHTRGQRKFTPLPLECFLNHFEPRLFIFFISTCAVETKVEMPWLNSQFL